jgi:hypothetical protein
LVVVSAASWSLVGGDLRGRERRLVVSSALIWSQVRLTVDRSSAELRAEACSAAVRAPPPGCRQGGVCAA